MHTELPPAMEIRILDARLNEWGLPRYQSEWAAVIDLHACLDVPPRRSRGRRRR